MENRVKSFRITDETAQKLKALSDEIGGNQNDLFNKLVTAYELENAKATLTDKAPLVDKLQKHCRFITDLFIQEIEESSIYESEVEAKYSTKLRLKSEKIDELELANKELDKANKKLSKELDELKKQVDANTTVMAALTELKDMQLKAFNQTTPEAPEAPEAPRTPRTPRTPRNKGKATDTKEAPEAK